MSNQLKENLNIILEEKNTKLLPENLKAGVTCLGITGELESGVDTSDATATASDIVSGKTAYVNGEVVTGTLDQATESTIEGSEAKDYPYEENTLMVTGTLRGRGVWDNTLINTTVPYNLITEFSGLTSDKIVSGNTILGVEGTGGGNAESTGDPIVVTSNYSWVDYVLFKPNLQITATTKSGDGISSMSMGLTSNLEVYSGSLTLTDGPNHNDSNVYTEILATVNGVNIYYVIQDLGGGDVFYYYHWVQGDNVHVYVLSRTEWTEQDAITFYNSVIIKLK